MYIVDIYIQTYKHSNVVVVYDVDIKVISLVYSLRLKLQQQLRKGEASKLYLLKEK